MNEEKLSREEDVSSINIMELLYKMLEKWHLFAIAIVVSVIACIFITKYSTPLYEAKTTLLIKSNNNMMSNLSGNFGFNFYNQDAVNFQNEIGTIQSVSMVKRTIKSLDLYVDYFQKNNFKTEDIVYTVDLRNAEILQDKNMYLQPGDVVYVEPNKNTKALSTLNIPLTTISNSLVVLTSVISIFSWILSMSSK